MLQQSEIFDRIVVSTDDQEIAGVARDAGADVPGVPAGRPR
jgi:CMP-N-acetylneuraminic acid synthetase